MDQGLIRLHKKFTHAPGEKRSSLKRSIYKSETSRAVLMPRLRCQIGDSDRPQPRRQRPFYTDLKKKKQLSLNG